MSEEKLRQKINNLTDDFCHSVRERLENYAEGLTLIGSCALNKIHLTRPDIGFFLLLKENASANVYLALGEIVTELQEKYKGAFCLRPEFRPFKTSYPIYKEGTDVWLSGSVAKVGEGNEAFPFGVPKTVLAGMQQARKVIFGKDFLKGIDTSLGKDYILSVVPREIDMYKLQLSLAPLVYNLNKDIALLFDEAVSLGKQAIRNGVWFVATETEITGGTCPKLFINLRKTLPFYKNRYGGQIAQFVRVILDARDHYHEWKANREETYKVFIASNSLIGSIQEKILKEAFDPRK